MSQVVESRKALLADSFSEEADVRNRHGDGVNVLYGDGSVKWVKLSATDPATGYVFGERLQQCMSVGGGDNPFINDIWKIFDAQ